MGSITISFRKYTKKNKKPYPYGTFTGIGIAIGTSVGLMVSMLLFNNSPIGAGVGFVLGLIFGSSLDRRN
jgi:hypothetical protein